MLTFAALKSGGQAGVVNATCTWQVAFYSAGPPPVVADLLTSARRGAFYGELVKLYDIRKVLDARAVIVSARRLLGVDEVRLATSFGIYVVLDGDAESLAMASGGAEVGEVNSRFVSSVLPKRSRRMASGCRNAILALLKEKWLTPEELVSELQLSYGEKTVVNQLRSLARIGKSHLLGRTVLGEGVYGMPGKLYPVRIDLSKSSKLKYLKSAVVQVLESCGRPVSSAEISEMLNVSKHQIRSVLRKLANEHKTAKTSEGWILFK